MPSKKELIQALKQGQDRVKAVHNCPVCQAHLNEIKEHQARGHPHD